MTENSTGEPEFDIEVGEISISEDEYPEVKEEEFPSIISTPGFKQKIILFFKPAFIFLGEKFDAVVNWVADNSSADWNRAGYSPWKVAISVIGVAVVVEVLANGIISILKHLLTYVTFNLTIWLLGILIVIFLLMFRFDSRPFLDESWRLHRH